MILTKPETLHADLTQDEAEPASRECSNNNHKRQNHVLLDLVKRIGTLKKDIFKRIGTPKRPLKSLYTRP